MPSYTLDDVKADITAALEAKHIWNVDFVTVKDRLTRLLSEGIKDATETYLTVYRGLGHHDMRDMTEIYYSGSLYPATFGSFVKKVTKTEKQGVNPVFQEALRKYRAYVDLFAPVCEQFVALKPFVVKGRKPSTDPRKTPERTLDNTGTCPVCFRNVKLHEGRMVAHGYEVKYHQFVGNCHGVGEKPFEVSAEGTQRYVDLLNRTKADFEKSLKALQTATTITFTRDWKSETVTLNKGDADFERQKNIKIENVKSNIRYVTSDIANYTKHISEWIAKPLPDGNNEHLK